MKRFDFPLEKVRHWRNEQASLEEIKLQVIHAELMAIDQQREQLQTDLAAEEARVRGPRTVEAADLASLDSFQDYARIKLKELVVKRLECDGRLNVQRQVLMEARRAYELLDKLRKKAVAEWRFACDKEQEELAAELYLAKRSRDAK